MNAQAFMDRTWRAEMIEGTPVTGANITLIIGSDRRAGGNAGCNTFGAPVRLDGMYFSFGPLTATRRACAADIMNQEQHYLDILARIGGWRMKNGQFFLTGSDGYDLIQFAAE